MPTYDYLCDGCGHEFEFFQSMSDKVKRKCPECGVLKLKRLIGTGGAVIFKGSGFYETDYRSDSYKKAAEADKKKVEKTRPKRRRPTRNRAGGEKVTRLGEEEGRLDRLKVPGLRPSAEDRRKRPRPASCSWPAAGRRGRSACSLSRTVQTCRCRPSGLPPGGSPWPRLSVSRSASHGSCRETMSTPEQ